ncbi:LysE family translocator [Massilia endophytica]|uniref:LysE family translocator n=1 Tax=Massilia endophytica TaxID=2899220 RepID=UPI001E5D06ED|nr:LysE family translocator [Massilia endophytica]UGQ46364.1 LysE family translocator [Massilia endophytica]
MENLIMFCGAVTLLLLSPGPNMAFVLAHSSAYGRSAGVAAAFGIGAADIILTLLTVAGFTSLVAAWPAAMATIRYAGACYLLYMAWRALAARSKPLDGELGSGAVFWRAVVNNLLNPKAILFFLVFIPQFVDPETASPAGQLLVLGLLLTAISTVFHTALAFAGGVLRFPGQRYLLAAVLLLLALRLLISR